MREEECVQEEDMGLIDVINGVLAGPRGQGQPQQPGAAQGGMSPITMAVLGVLAYKALKGSGILGGAQPAAGGGTAGGGLGGVLAGLGGALGGGAPAGYPGGSQGGLGDLLSGGLGSLLGGGSGGSMLTSGLSNLVSDLQNAGQARAAQSWVGSGPNQPIAPNALSAALGEDTIQALTQQTGMPRENLLAALSQHLPEVVNQLTPAGRLPTESEAAELLDTATAGGAAGKSQAS
jgi:uncharacterized protein YidB (DUF937 family)